MSKYRPVASFCLQGGAIQPEDGPDEVSRGGDLVVRHCISSVLKVVRC